MKRILLLLSLSTAFMWSCSKDKSETDFPDTLPMENVSEAALNVLNEAIDDDPSNDNLFYKRAKYYAANLKFKSALDDINKAIELNGEKGEYFLMQGDLYLELGNLKEAEAAALKAESLMESTPALVYLLSNIYLEKQDSIKYNKYVAITRQLIPFKAEADYVYGRKLLSEKDSSHAMNHFQSAVKKDQDFLPAYKEIIKMYMNKGMYDSSISFVLNGIRISYQYPLFYEAQGKFYEKYHLYGAAESAYLIALKYSPNKQVYYKLLGDLNYNKRYDYTKAHGWYAQMLKEAPNDEPTLKRCAESAYNSKDWQQSLTYYYKLKSIDTLNVQYKKLYEQSVKYAEQKDTTNQVNVVEGDVTP